MKLAIIFSLIFVMTFANTGCDKDDDILPPSSSPVSIAPEVDAGPDIGLEIPRTSTTLCVLANISDLSYQWRKISGPESYFLEWLDRTTAQLIWMEEGEYAFELSATNTKNGLTGRDTVLVTVSSNLKKLTLTNIKYDSAGFLKAEISASVINNIEWVFCKIPGRCERAGNGPSPNINYDWGGYYYELLPGNKISVFGGYSDIDAVDIIIYYSE